MGTAVAASPPVLTVREVLAEDLAPVAALKRRVERRDYAGLASPDALAVRLHRRGTAWWLLGRLAAGDLLLLAEVDGLVVGLGAARWDGDAVHLHSGCVEGYGAGRALLSARLEAARGLGLTRVTANAFVGSAAEGRLGLLGMERRGPDTPSLTFPGVPLSHWSGTVHTALTNLSRRRTP